MEPDLIRSLSKSSLMILVCWVLIISACSLRLDNEAVRVRVDLHVGLNLYVPNECPKAVAYWSMQGDFMDCGPNIILINI